MEPMLNGSFFLMGDIVDNAVDESSLLKYDFENKGYYIDKLLKQGGYNYMFGFRRSGSVSLSLMPMEGSFWQTENTYRICLYHRAFGARYDRLIAVGEIIS
jgi:hypothetical protein